MKKKQDPVVMRETTVLDMWKICTGVTVSLIASKYFVHSRCLRVLIY